MSDWRQRLWFPTPSPEDWQTLIDRLARERWIQAAMVTNDPLEILWAEKGRERMTALVPILMKLAPPLFNPDAKRCGQLAGCWYQWQLIWHSRELRWPRMTLRQDTALMYIVLRLAETHRGAEISKWFKTSIA